MKIALIVHCFFPEHIYGTETYTLQIARNLRELGHEPIVISAVFEGERQRESLITQYSFEGIPVHCIDKNHLPGRRLKDRYLQEEIGPVLDRLLTQLDPDVIHVTHLANHTATLLDVADARRIPRVITLTDFFGFCFNNHLRAADDSQCAGPSPSRVNCMACSLRSAIDQRLGETSRLARWPVPQAGAALMRTFATGRMRQRVSDIAERPALLRQRYAGFRAAIAPTRFLASAYKANGFDMPIHVQHFGTDIPRAVKTAGAGAPLRFGFIGQVAAHKGIDLLVEAFRRLPPGSATLEVFGSGEPGYVAAIQDRSQGLEISFRGTFPSQDMARVLATFDFLVIPSRWVENSPLVLLASLASGTPVVISNVAGMSEFVDEHRNGLLFEKGNADALYSILRDLVSDPQAARGMSATTAYPRSTRAMTEDVIRIYHAVAESAGESLEA